MGNYFRRFFFSFEGRIGRRSYWVYFVLPLTMVGFVAGFFRVLDDVTLRQVLVVGLPMLPFIVWVGSAVAAKRWHDFGFSGWWAVLGFVPLLNYVLLIALGIVPGSKGSNRYGNDPNTRSAAL
jgi:uncharacterized membrane protein YhaH (DUF805 family)